MKGLWYGDRRDRVKWGALVHLARCHKIQCIIQVAYFRQGELPKLETNGREFDLPHEVWSHFSDLDHIMRLGEACHLSIHVFDTEFETRRRKEYVSALACYLRGVQSPRIVFLDPDTGFGTKAEHVTRDDASQIRSSLRSGDLLVLYQHADRTKTWRENRAAAFAAA